MTRGRWVLHPITGELIPADQYRRPTEKRATCIPTPMLIRDGMDSVWNPLDGQRYDSRSSYQKAVKERGGHIVGNDMPLPTGKDVATPPDLRKDVARAIEQSS